MDQKQVMRENINSTHNMYGPNNSAHQTNRRSRQFDTRQHPDQTAPSTYRGQKQSHGYHHQSHGYHHQSHGYHHQSHGYHQQSHGYHHQSHQQNNSKKNRTQELEDMFEEEHLKRLKSEEVVKQLKDLLGRCIKELSCSDAAESTLSWGEMMEEEGLQEAFDATKPEIFLVDHLEAKLKEEAKNLKNRLKEEQEKRQKSEEEMERLKEELKLQSTALRDPTIEETLRAENRELEDKIKALQSGELIPTEQKPPAKKKKSSRELFYKIEALEQNIEALSLKLEETEMERDHQKTRADDLLKQMEETEKGKDHQRTRADDLQKQLEETKLKTDHQTTRADDLQKQLEETKLKRDHQRTRADDLLEQLKKTEKESDRKTTRINYLLKQLEEKSGEDRTLQRPPHKNEEEASSGVLQMEGIMEELEAAKHSNLDLASKLLTAEEANLALRKALDDSREKGKELDLMVNRLEEEVSDKIRLGVKLTDQFTAEICSLLLEVEALKDEASSREDLLGGQVKELTSRNGELSSQLSAVMKEHQDLLRALDATTRNEHLLRQRLEDLEDKQMKEAVMKTELIQQLKTSNQIENTQREQLKTLKEELQAQKDSSLLLTSKVVVQEAICKAVQDEANEEVDHQTSRANNFEKKLEKVRRLFHESEEVSVWRRVKKTPHTKMQATVQAADPANRAGVAVTVPAPQCSTVYPSES